MVIHCEMWAQNGADWLDLLVVIIFIVIAGLSALIKKFQESKHAAESGDEQVPRQEPAKRRINLEAIQQRIIEQERLRQAQQAGPVVKAEQPVRAAVPASTTYKEPKKAAGAARRHDEKFVSPKIYEEPGYKKASVTEIDLDQIPNEELGRMIVFKEILGQPVGIREERIF